MYCRRSSLENQTETSPKAIEGTTFRAPIFNFLSVYWKSLIVVVWPIILLPLIIFSNDKVH